MTVFVITSAFDYEGEIPSGVAASLEMAKAIGSERAENDGYCPATDWAKLDDRWELSNGSSQIVIREEEVQT